MHVFNITYSNIKNFLLKLFNFNKKATNKNILNHATQYILLVPSSIKKIIIDNHGEKFNHDYIVKLIDNEKINAHLQTMCHKQKLDGVVCEIEKK